MTPKPEDCQSMTDVRKGVDRLDRELVRLLVIRQGYMSAAARIKQDREAVYDADRIEEIVTKILSSAQDNGLSADIAEPVWRKLMERCIAFEFEEWDRLRENKRKATN